MKKIQRSVVYSIVVVAAALILCTVILLATFSNIGETGARVAGDAEPPLPIGYIIKSESNQIVVYEYGGTKPINTIDVPPSSLPGEEQKALKEGVYVESEEALRMRLEDYTG